MLLVRLLENAQDREEKLSLCARGKKRDSWTCATTCWLLSMVHRKLGRDQNMLVHGVMISLVGDLLHAT